MTTMHLGRLLAQRANLSPQRTALAGPDARWTFAQFGARCTRLARHLAAQGVRPGDRVAVYACWGEVPVAFVVQRPGAGLPVDEVVAVCRECLAGYMCVKAVEFVDALLQNPVGKVFKRRLRVA